MLCEPWEGGSLQDLEQILALAGPIFMEFEVVIDGLGSWHGAAPRRTGS